MKTISITKEEINELPLYKFSGKIKLIESKSDAINAIKILEQESVLGFDTETRAAFKKGERYDISLIQLSTRDHAFLFRINKFDMCKEIAILLENPKIIKAGVAIRDDIKGLKALYPFEEKGFVDLAVMAKERSVTNFGLRALTAIFLGRRLSKRSQTSNWEVNQLTQAQITYAACDAVVGFEIYNKLLEI